MVFASMVLLVAGAGLVGCVVPGTAPVSSASQYATNAPVEEGPSGEVSAGAGYLLSDGDPISFVGDGGAVFRLTERYDLSIRGRADVTTFEGNLRIVDDESVRVGWLHGVGGLVMILDDNEMMYHATTGLSVVAGDLDQTAFFGAFRVAHAEGSSEDIIETQYAIASMGLRTAAGSHLNVSPELQVGYGRELEEVLIAPMVSLSAPF